MQNPIKIETRPQLPPSSDAHPSAEATAVRESEAQLDVLRQRAMEHELRMSDLSVKVGQLRARREQAGPRDIPKLDAQVATAQHDVTAAAIQLSATHDQIRRLEQKLHGQEAQLARSADLAQLSRLDGAPAPITLQPPPEPFLGREEVMQIWAGGAVLLFPLVLALARRLWVRGGRATPAADLESSPRLQRMEQAIESIAIEVERIGEAQRFATKLMADRAESANRLGAAPMPVARREPGTVTPH